MREVACVGVARTLLGVEIPARDDPPSGRGVVALASGTHGDEPAAPWALYSLVRDGLLDGAFAYRIWPCINPTGNLAGTRTNAEGVDINRSFGRGGTTPEARAILTANRDRSFALSLDLHEDPEADGFYCYELFLPDREGADPAPIGPACVRAAEEAGFPIQTLGPEYDLGYPPEMDGAVGFERGRIVPDVAVELRVLRSALPYNPALLRRRATQRTLTFESPGRADWDVRLGVHRVAVVEALRVLRARC